MEELNVTPVESAVTELLSLEEEPLQLNLPATSVAVERAVKDVTKAAAICSDSKERDGLIFQFAASRKKVPYDKRNKVMSA